MSGVVADTSIWIDFFNGRNVPALEEALAEGTVVVAPIVVAELVSGARSRGDRTAISRLLDDIALHETPLEHWVSVGELRHALRGKGLTVSTPDAHVAQCALERKSLLLTRDRIFAKIAKWTDLRVSD